MYHTKKPVPKYAQRLLRWYCHPEYLEEIEWNLEELFKENCDNYGLKGAQKRYWGDVFKHIRPMFIKKWSIQFLTQNQTIMWSNYLKIALRNFSRNKVYSFINLSGLILGITSCLIILQYTSHEMSYDNFHEKGENVYRLQEDEYKSGELMDTWAAGCAAIGPSVKANLPEVLDYVKLRRSNTALTYQNNVFREDRGYYASESFFKIFSYELLQGVDSLVLKAPYTMVISRSTANKYFGDENPVGKIMKLNSRYDYVVTGVFNDPPENTHLKADVLFSFETYAQLRGEDARSSWGWWGFWTYIEVAEGTQRTLLKQKIDDLVGREIGASLRERDMWQTFNLQPIEDIHLHSNLTEEFEANGDIAVVYGLLVVAGFILVIAWLNFISLSTARAMHRARETGIRKVMGSSRGQLVSQFLFESLFFNILAAGLSLTLAILMSPYFESLAGKPLTSSLFSKPFFWVVFPIIILIGAFLSGLYPALVVSGYKPISTLKGNFITSTKGQTVRKLIVIFQFTISLVLIVGTLTVYSQIQYMQTKDLGMEMDQTIIIKAPSLSQDSTYTSKYRAFKTELLRQPTIKSIAVSSDVPGFTTDSNNIGDNVRREGQSETAGVNFRLIDIDPDFVSSYNMKIATGRNFSTDRNTVASPILVNEIGAWHMGFKDLEEAIGKKISFWGEVHEIVGILENYHQESPKNDFQPIIFSKLSDEWSLYYSIKVDSDNVPKTLSNLNGTFDQFFPGNAFDYFFLDNHYQQQYQSQQLFRKLFNLFSGLAIFIGCMGLSGLSAYTILQKMKEIGIRKVLGASMRQIIVLLGSEFSKLIIIAVIIGLPTSWLLMDDWLSGFAFRIEMNWQHFAIPALILFVIAALTIYYQVHKAATTNPVDSLKDE